VIRRASSRNRLHHNRDMLPPCCGLPRIQGLARRTCTGTSILSSLPPEPLAPPLSSARPLARSPRLRSSIHPSFASGPLAPAPAAVSRCPSPPSAPCYPPPAARLPLLASRCSPPAAVHRCPAPAARLSLPVLRCRSPAARSLLPFPCYPPPACPRPPSVDGPRGAIYASIIPSRSARWNLLVRKFFGFLVWRGAVRAQGCTGWNRLLDFLVVLSECPGWPGAVIR
jgi:hypothetical protein